MTHVRVYVYPVPYIRCMRFFSNILLLSRRNSQRNVLRKDSCCNIRSTARTKWQRARWLGPGGAARRVYLWKKVFYNSALRERVRKTTLNYYFLRLWVVFRTVIMSRRARGMQAALQIMRSILIIKYSPRLIKMVRRGITTWFIDISQKNKIKYAALYLIKI